MDFPFKILIEIVRKKVRVTLHDGRQISGLITSHDEFEKDKIIRISILESKPLGIPVSILTADIEKLEILDEPNPYLDTDGK